MNLPCGLLACCRETNIMAAAFPRLQSGFARHYPAARARKNRTCNCYKTTLKDWDCLTDYFDYVVSCQCIGHVPRPREMVQEFYWVLKPGGHFYITTENYLNGMLLGWAKSWIG